MTEPLIDRDEIASAIWERPDAPTGSADRVLAYLRSVLTPEALQTYRTATGYYSTSVQMGTDLRRRIFGEDG